MPASFARPSFSLWVEQAVDSAQGSAVVIGHRPNCRFTTPRRKIAAYDANITIGVRPVPGKHDMFAQGRGSTVQRLHLPLIRVANRLTKERRRGVWPVDSGRALCRGGRVVKASGHMPWLAVSLLLALMPTFVQLAQPAFGEKAAATGSPEAAVSAPAQPAAVRMTAATFSGNLVKTKVTFDLTGPVKPAIFVLGDPARVIIDVPDLQFKFDPTREPAAAGLVSAWRYGLFATRKSRIVLDAKGPVRVDQVRSTGGQGGQPSQLIVELAATDEASFAAALKAQPAVVKSALRGSVAEEMPASGRANAKPVILIDPGHGGLDPGAVAGGVLEKNVVLAVARQLRAQAAGVGAVRRRHDAIDRRFHLSGSKAAGIRAAAGGPVHLDPCRFCRRGEPCRECPGCHSLHTFRAGVRRAGANPGREGERRRPPCRSRTRGRKRPGSGAQHPGRPDEA